MAADRTAADRPGFVRWLLMGRAKQDAYLAGVFERKGWTPEDAVRAAGEVRAAARGIPRSPWFREKLEAMP